MVFLSVAMSKRHNPDETDDGGKPAVPRIDRRKFLGAAGAGLVTTVGAAQIARASSDSSDITEEERRNVEKLVSEYNSPEQFESAFREHGSELMDVLSGKGLLSSAEIGALSSELLTPEDYEKTSSGALLIGSHGIDGAYVRLQVKKQVSDLQQIVAVVKPQSSHQYAFNETGDVTVIVDPDSDQQEVVV